jgi:hypothetical protein
MLAIRGRWGLLLLLDLLRLHLILLLSLRHLSLSRALGDAWDFSDLVLRAGDLDRRLLVRLSFQLKLTMC